MKHSKKSDEELRAFSATLDALLVGSNFLKEYASLILTSVVEHKYTTGDDASLG
jgi:hypothetical protein